MRELLTAFVFVGVSIVDLLDSDTFDLSEVVVDNRESQSNSFLNAVPHVLHNDFDSTGLLIVCFLSVGNFHIRIISRAAEIINPISTAINHFILKISLKKNGK